MDTLTSHTTYTSKPLSVAIESLVALVQTVVVKDMTLLFEVHMQTFLPYPDFIESAACLDTRRLGKQRVEVLQLLQALLVHGAGWSHHPAAKMWEGHESSLAAYGFNICKEWISRGFKDTCLDKIEALCKPQWDWFDPPWLGDPLFHASHRSNLLRKDRAHYGRFGWTEPDNLPYVWPTP